MCKSFGAALTITAALVAVAAADTLVLRDGTKIENCYVRDEGVRLLVWENMDDVGTDRYRVIGRKDMHPGGNAFGHRAFTLERDPNVWDAQPQRGDLTVVCIEINPKLPSLHGAIDYSDPTGRPKINSDRSPKLKPVEGEAAYMQQEKAVADLKYQRAAGDKVTLTAHVKNVGFKPISGFSYSWKIDDQVVDEGRFVRPLNEMETATFDLPWKWQDGFHHATFSVTTDQPEIATINNTLKDPLWGLSFTYFVSQGRVDAWHQFRSAYGTFCFEDYYRWHVDIMNLLFEKSVYPSCPDGIKARVRLDRIVIADKVQGNRPFFDGQAHSVEREDGLRYDQGGWMWNDSDEELETGEWIQVNPDWRNRTEWSLPHELGHQLGLVDWYALDFGGGDRHIAPDTGDPINHFMNHPVTMMHWHGPQVFSEVDAGYLNATWNKPRGYFGDMYFDLPAECFVRVVDVNGEPVVGAKVELFQRGTKLDPAGQPQQDQGVTYYPVLEDGDFYSPEVQQVTAKPVIVGQTDADGVMRLPNRPVKEVITLNGCHRKPNPFGNMNVVGQRQLMLVKVTQDDRTAHFFLEGHDFTAAWYRGHKDRYTTVLKTPFGSVDSPPAPADVKVEKLDEHRVKVTWQRPPIDEYNYTYLQEPIGYQVYLRVGNMGLNDRPWTPIGATDANTFELTYDLRQRPADTDWFGDRGGLTKRFAVSTLADLCRESALTPGAPPLPR